jgi:hypothetical protein
MDQKAKRRKPSKTPILYLETNFLKLQLKKKLSGCIRDEIRYKYSEQKFFDVLMPRWIFLGTCARLFRTDKSRNQIATWINYEEIDQMDLAEVDEEIKFECFTKS